MKRLFSSVVLVLALAGSPAHADSLLGTWLSPPDHKGQVGHLQLSKCGAAFCGTVVRAFDKTGTPVVTPAVGRMLLWDMQPSGPSTYRGMVYMPLMKGTFPAEMQVSGNRLTVRGCSKLGLCRAQTWTKMN